MSYAYSSTSCLQCYISQFGAMSSTLSMSCSLLWRARACLWLHWLPKVSSMADPSPAPWMHLVPFTAQRHWDVLPEPQTAYHPSPTNLLLFLCPLSQHHINPDTWSMIPENPHSCSPFFLYFLFFPQYLDLLSSHRQLLLAILLHQLPS